MPGTSMLKLADAISQRDTNLQNIKELLTQSYADAHTRQSVIDIFGTSCLGAYEGQSLVRLAAVKKDPMILSQLFVVYNASIGKFPNQITDTKAQANQQEINVACMVAVKCGNADIVQLLLEYGADPLYTNAMGAGMLKPALAANDQLATLTVLLEHLDLPFSDTDLNKQLYAQHGFHHSHIACLPGDTVDLLTPGEQPLQFRENATITVPITEQQITACLEKPENMCDQLHTFRIQAVCQQTQGCSWLQPGDSFTLSTTDGQPPYYLYYLPKEAREEHNRHGMFQQPSAPIAAEAATPDNPQKSCTIL